ncbi:MAG: hypothetical protein AAGF33_16985 [Pseudomonadota bacterium]
MVHVASRIAVTLVFGLIYAAFVWETAALIREFGLSGMGGAILRMYAQNFVFFPLAGLVALVTFWRPAVFVTDALARGRIRGGRTILTGVLLVCMGVAWVFSSAFGASDARSLYEIAPSALRADQGIAATATAPRQAPVSEILIKLKINAGNEGGLSSYQSSCNADWLRFSSDADEAMLCFPAGEEISIAACCQAKQTYRQRINEMQAETPSQLVSIHRLVLPVKAFFLLILFFIGLLMVRFRKKLRALYGPSFERVSFGLAAGGLAMLIWPLLNATYISTSALLIGGWSDNTYAVVAPLIALGFGVWAVLLVFFHLRAYPSQIEYIAKLGGIAGAVIGMVRYNEIIAYLNATLGVGGGPVATIVFAVVMLGLLTAIVLDFQPNELDVFNELDENEASDEVTKARAPAE